MTNSHDDEKVSRLIDIAGLEGYGFWWILMEAVAANLDQKNTPSCTYSERKWWSICRSSARSFRKHLAICRESSLIQIEISGDQIKIEIPNLLKYRDEYSRKSGHSPDTLLTRVRSDSGTDTDTDTDTDTEIEKEKKKKKKKHNCGEEESADSALLKGIVAAWNEIVSNPKVRGVTSERKRHIKARIHGKEAGSEISWWREYFIKISESPFLMQGQNWFSFDWCLNQQNMAKILEGNYHRDKGNGRATPTCPRCNGTGKYTSRRIDPATREFVVVDVECECGGKR